MRVSFERTGGFAGMRMTAALDSDSLSPDEQRDLRDMIETAGFFQLPKRIIAPTPGADRFIYRVTVEAEGQRHTVEMGEAAIPPPLRPLLERLTTAARRT